MRSLRITCLYGTGFLALASLVACSQIMDVCQDDLQVRVTPPTVALSVGQRVTAQAEFRGCGGRDRLEDRIRWGSEAPAVARVDPTSGEITALAPGRAVVVPTGARYGRSPTSVQVDVRE